MEKKLPRVVKPWGSVDWERGALGDLAEVVSIPATTEEALIAAVAQDVDVLLGDVVTPITRRVLESAPRLRAVFCYSTGVDYVDVAAATELGIVVSRTPDYAGLSVAEHAIALMLAMARNVVAADASTRQGQWHQGWAFRGVEVEGKTLGVVGFGQIGQLVGKKAAGLGMKVIAHDPYMSTDRIRAGGAEPTTLQELLTRADFVTLHVPLVPATRGLIGQAEIASMKKGARLINCARGGVVDEGALLKALREGHLAGAALDVFEREPAEASNPLFELANVTVTPHIAWDTEEALRRGRAIYASELRKVVRGERPDYIVNPEVWERRRLG